MKGVFNCLDCEVNTSDIKEYYMVEHYVWWEANPKDKGMLCIGCLEKRLDRTLTHADFLDCALSTESYSQSDRLSNRLEGFSKRRTP